MCSGGTASATEVSGNLTTGMEKEKDATMTAKVEPSGEAFVTSSLRSVDGENIKKADYVQLTTVRTIYRSEDRVVEVKKFVCYLIYKIFLFLVILNYFWGVIIIQFESLRNPEDNASMEKLVAMDDLCDEVNNTSEYEDEDGNMIDDAEDEYDEEQPDAKSIGKKIWTFFTT